VVKDDSDRLSALRQELCRRLGPQRYELWLGPQTALTHSDGLLRVRCPSPAEARWLRRNISAALAECTASVFGASLRIEFEGAGETKQKELFDASASAGAEAPAPAACAVEEVAANQPATATCANEGSPVKHQRWTFTDFVVGPANCLAAQAARETAQQPGRFSPLLVYGPPGAGKSHLLSAVVHHARASRSRLRIMQMTAEQFTTQFLQALEQRSLPSFRQKMRGLDVLAIDDVQFLVGKKATLEELLYTIDALQGRGAQVVLSSDRGGAEMKATCPELAARISSGLSVAVDPPDYETRVGIVRGMARRMLVALDDGVVELIAQQVVGSARLLSGAINRLVATSMAMRKPISITLAGLGLSEFTRQHSPQVRLVDIQRAVCDVFGVESSSLKSASKMRAIAEPRMLAMWLARRYTRAALSEIGDFFGRRSHSTVVSAQRKFDGLISRRGEIVVGDQTCPVEEAVRRIEAKLRTA
jgi:chromosomal replication initiator protein